MRRKFVQIAAIILAFSMLPVSYAAAESDIREDSQQVDSGGTLVSEDAGIETGSEHGTIGSPDGADNLEQGVTKSDGDGTAPEQGTIEPGSDGVDPEQGTTEPGSDGVDPEQGTTEPGGDGVDPEQGTTEPEVPEVIIPVLETEEKNGNIIRVGLNYDSKVLSSGNLQNSIGSGYRFGFEDGDVFYKVGYTAETKISVLKTKNLYYSAVLSDGYSGYSETVSEGAAVGCVHLQLPGTYATFDETKAAADAVGGFPAWVNGEYSVRVGVYLSANEARAAQEALGLADATVVGTSVYGFIVVITGTNTPIFQYDGDGNYPMFIVKPGTDNSVKTVTYYKGIKYYGSFRYERINGGDITVVNLVDIDDYVRGVIPYEMSPSWPVEALKAQAVAARSYAIANTNSRHKKLNFDVCTSTCCQVYYGTGGATERTDQAVDETAGQFAWYDDDIILAVFHASDGGATENSENVWVQALPYLRGVIDSYEILAADKNPYNEWTKTFTGKQLQEILNKEGFGSSEIVNVKITPTDTGNVYSLTFTDTNGKNWTLSKYGNVKSLFGLKSMRYSISGGNNYVLTDTENTLGTMYGAWVLDGNGNLVQVSASPVYAMTANGVEKVPGSDVSEATFVFKGSGSGHNLGLSQWGAYAMAKEGFTYDQILKFYFTGIEIHI